ncbi:hypothetical protein CKO27_11925 [Thiocystis violacea]|nr:hypothetical protein [Thiocystis violacea]
MLGNREAGAPDTQEPGAKEASGGRTPGCVFLAKRMIVKPRRAVVEDKNRIHQRPFETPLGLTSEKVYKKLVMY